MTWLGTILVVGENQGLKHSGLGGGGVGTRWQLHISIWCSKSKMLLKMSPQSQIAFKMKSGLPYLQGYLCNLFRSAFQNPMSFRSISECVNNHFSYITHFLWQKCSFPIQHNLVWGKCTLLTYRISIGICVEITESNKLTFKYNLWYSVVLFITIFGGDSVAICQASSFGLLTQLHNLLKYSRENKPCAVPCQKRSLPCVCSSILRPRHRSQETNMLTWGNLSIAGYSVFIQVPLWSIETILAAQTPWI
jgi:hypothetical protein